MSRVIKKMGVLINFVAENALLRRYFSKRKGRNTINNSPLI
jgi:hypothetical protein